MLFLLFQLGGDRFALEANRVVEVVPLVEFKRVPQAPPGVAGIFNYRGRPIPAVDLSELTFGRPAAERLSTRIIVIKHRDNLGKEHLLGLIAEHATDLLQKDPAELVAGGTQLRSAPYLGPIFMDARGPVQCLRDQHLLPPPVRQALFSESGLAALVTP